MTWVAPGCQTPTQVKGVLDTPLGFSPALSWSLQLLTRLSILLFHSLILGCACDVKSINYQFSFEPNYEWSKTYAGQQEIWEYLRKTARKNNIYEKIRFRTEITRTEWREDLQQWVLDYTNLETGEQHQTRADIVFSGMGPLRIPQIPKQFDAFEGPKWHTAQWNHDYDLTGKRVAIVGSGAR